MRQSSSYILGIDTSNYTTSAALYNLTSNKVTHKRKLLPVKNGQLGLRQSDAVFHHTQQLPTLIGELFSEFDSKLDIAAVGVSAKPRDEVGSYMPCFTVGTSAADILSSVLKVPVYRFSHQSGHIAAAVYSSGRSELYENRFLAFHVSGGTTEAVLVEPDNEKIFKTSLVAKSLDLHAGQAIDRIGVSLGLTFPCGKELEKLALCFTGKVKVKPCVKGYDCCLSGIENICKKMIADGIENTETAFTCLKFVGASLEKMCENILTDFGDMPVLFAGGVMSNSIIRNDLSDKFNCVFAKPEYSTDNACGTSVLAARRYFKELVE